jgi:hypothetical protein
MRKTLLLGALAALACAAQAAVTVTFVDPQKYTDIGRYQGADTALMLKDLESHLQELGKRLPPGQNLTVEFLDIDLAGEDRFAAARGRDIRIQSGGADWPRMRVRYTLERDGQKETREETLTDMTYLQRPERSTDSLVYEKRMLAEWFMRRFVPGKAKAAAK